MNRSLRSIFNKHLSRAFASLTLTMLTVLAFGQITNCPTGFVNLIVDDATNCTADFDLTPAISAAGTASFTSTGATDVMANTDLLMLSGFAFEFGVSEVTIVEGANTCIFTVVTTSASAPFLELCDDVTVDLAGECSGEYDLPSSYTQTGTGACAAGEITFSFSDVDPTSTSLPLDATMLGDMTVQVYISNGTDQGSCAKTITVEDSAPIVARIGCPSDFTAQVAPTCQYVSTFSIIDTIPCGGSTVQTSGPVNNTVIPLGTTTYSFDVLDDTGTTAATCTWSVTVEESTEVGAQVNCISAVNLSLDQTCEVEIDPFTFVTGQICGDVSLYSVMATLPTGEELSGASITLTQDLQGMEIDITVFDPNGVNSCWSTVTVEDKLAPLIMCPDDVTVTCLESIDTSETGIPILLTGTEITDTDDDVLEATISNGSCVVELFFTDFIQDFQCNGDFQRIVSRTFWVIDNAGNRSESCTQQIFVTRESLASTVFPEHYDGLDVHTGISDNGVGSNPSLACDGQDIAWNSEISAEGRIVPSPFDSITPSNDTIPGTGAPSGVGTCGTIFSFYEDIVIEICNDGCENYNPSFKVLRKWDIFDWCTGEMAIHEQIIKVIDSVPPVFTIGVPDMTVSTDLWGCGATIDLPEILAVDQCATDIAYSWYVSNGTYDAVLNKVYIADNALTEEGEEIVLVAFAEDCCGNTVSDTGYVTIIDAIPPVVVADEHTVVSLNNQEGDGSTKVHIETFDDGSWDNCGPIEWWMRRMDNACEGYDGLDSEGNVDTTELDEVNDFHKYLHFCCEDVDSIQRVIFMVCDDGDRDGVVETNGDDNCTTAMILVDVQDKIAPTIVCPNPVTINCIEFAAYEDFYDADLTDDQIDKLDTRFGEAFTTSTCGELGDQTFEGEEFCGIGSVTRTFTVMNTNGSASCTQVISVEADSTNVLTCDRISFPTLSLAPNNYDWCDPVDTVAPFVKPVILNGCGEITIEEPVIDRDNLCTQAGVNVTLDTFDFASGGCMKILAHWEVIDECIFDENYFNPITNEVDPFVTENGYFEIYIEYDIFDEEGPEIECEDLIVETADCEYNFGVFSVNATDECTPADALGYLYKVDFNADGTYDYPSGEDSFGESNSFDASDVGGLPIGKHSIKWVVSDGCGNYTTCVQDIEVVQRIKAPTPYCYLGLSSAVMDSIYGCSVELWADDFVADQSLGACGETLDYLMIPYQDIFGDPADATDDLSVEDAFDMAEPNWEFGCEYIENGVQHVIEIRIYAVDENGVYDYCDASLTLNDNFDCCSDVENGTTLISGNVMTEEGVVMEDVELRLDGDSPELPKSLFSSANGSFVFYGVDYDQDYRISAHSNKDPLNGVTTLDLVVIQRHIMGMTRLDSPYKMIAADINGSESITVVDLLQLRKLILGLYPNNDFPNNKSWRFLDDSYQFVDLTRPFPFNEVIHISQLPHSMYNQNFVAVKVGDVNNSIVQSVNNDAERRSIDNYNLAVEDRIFTLGEKVEIPVTADKAKAIFGFQFSLDINDRMMKDVKVNGDALEFDASNYVIRDGQMKVSWNSAELTRIEEEDVLFTLTFTAASSGKLSEAMKMSLNGLHSEVYNEELNADDLGITFRTLEGSAFAVMQNEPNPFSASTSINFTLPQSGRVGFKVYDISGKMLIDKSGTYDSGVNTINVSAKDLNVDGVFYYQLEFNGEQLTKKMILVK